MFKAPDSESGLLKSKIGTIIMSLRNNKLFTDLEYYGLCKVQYGFYYCEGVQNPISGSDDKCFICRTVVEGEQCGE